MTNNLYNKKNSSTEDMMFKLNIKNNNSNNNSSNNSNNVLEDEFHKTKNPILKNFIFRNPEEINRFLLSTDYNNCNNHNFVLFLKRIENEIRKYFKKEKLFLEFVGDPEWELSQLVLYIQTKISDENIDFLYKKVSEIERGISHLLNDNMNNNLNNKFLIDVE
ncbi:MAG: hypothetical protein ACRC1M_02075 [Methanobacteriaceae archaeon]